MNIWNRIRPIAALAIVWAAFHICSDASAIPSRPESQRLVNDMAGLFTAEQSINLEQMLVAFDDTTSNQIAVVTVPDLEGYEAYEYATRIGQEWGVGSEKFDNGIVVLIKPKTDSSMGEVFIAVGYGLEGAIPDSYAKRIIEGNMIPHFRENDYYKGAEEACVILMKLASGEISEPAEDDDAEVWAAAFVLLMIIIIAVVVISSNSSGNGNGNGNGGRRRTIYTGPVITRGGGWNSGGGSFGGGSFGGFGGGSFGGGGAGGRW